MKHLALQILKALDFMHEHNMTHSNITSSQIGFDRRGKVRLGPGWGTILKHKDVTSTTLDQHKSLCQLLSDNTSNFKNKQ